jgi:hypothetical protein
MKFPRLVYKSLDGKTFEYMPVDCQVGYDSACAVGWSPTVPDAISTFYNPKPAMVRRKAALAKGTR